MDTLEALVASPPRSAPSSLRDGPRDSPSAKRRRLDEEDPSWREVLNFLCALAGREPSAEVPVTSLHVGVVAAAHSPAVPARLPASEGVLADFSRISRKFTSGRELEDTRPDVAPESLVFPRPNKSVPEFSARFTGAGVGPPTGPTRPPPPVTATDMGLL